MKKLVFTSAVFLLVGAVLAQPGLVKPAAQGQLTACKSNLKNMAVALEMYASDFSGDYPSSLSRLVNNDPNFSYLKHVPTCPAAARDTYSSTYKMSRSKRDPKSGKSIGIDSFSFHCSGHQHKAAGGPPNKPAYDSERGLIDR